MPPRAPRPCSLRGERIPAKYQVREAGWHETIDTDVQEMLAGGARPVQQLHHVLPSACFSDHR